MKKEKSMIITKYWEYSLYNYQRDVELEEMIIEHSKEIFEENTYYINTKKRIYSKAGSGTEPDGYVRDFDKKIIYY